MKGSGPGDHSEGAESLVEEPVDEMSATPACPERFPRCREVAPSQGGRLDSVQK